MKNLWLLCIGLFTFNCQPAPTSSIDTKKLIVETLEKETQYFCERNLAKWQDQWSQQSFVSKIYTGNTPFKEFNTWGAINQNTVDHIKEFPAPITIPKNKPIYTIELFEQTAFVFYTQNGKRETRFMVKEGDKWKIARMQTIY